MDNIVKLARLVIESNNIVFFGGAGVSTESGIPDFRSAHGIHNQRFKYPPQVILSHSFFISHPVEFYEFYWNSLGKKDIKPNAAHLRLAQLEREGKIRAVITQNTDGLHQLAGSKNVLELHGSTRRYYCILCGKEYDQSVENFSNGVPRCVCGGIIRPDVVLYEERLDSNTIVKAAQYICDADMLIIGGTSLIVYPAAGLTSYYRGNKLILINHETTPMDSRADIVLHESIGKVFENI